MKTIIAGSRYGCPPRVLADALFASGFLITEVVSGCALGVDMQGEAFAAAQGIPMKLFPADWSKLGKRAGPVRNAAMAAYADALIAVRMPGASPGTDDMIQQATALGLKVYVHRVTP